MVHHVKELTRVACIWRVRFIRHEILFILCRFNFTGFPSFQGARWDINNGVIAESNLKELTPLMPVIFVKAIPVDRKEVKNIYDCPVYKTKSRGPTFVWTFNLKTKDKPGKWVLGGVAILLQV